MKTVQRLSLLTLALTIASCNEKVSPELQQSNATTPSTTTVVPPTEYYFRVVNKADELLNYKLHKTGDGGYLKDCKITNTSGFSSDVYRGNPTDNDITCYLDGEELSLFSGGLSFAIESSKNTCEFVGYSPFGFFDRIPGDSSGTYTEIKCMNDTTTAAEVLAADTANASFDTTVNGGNLGCNELASEDMATGTREGFSITSDQDLCSFNYNDGDGEKCDIGIVYVNSWRITYTPGDGLTIPASTKVEKVRRKIDCGGKIHNCVKGPTKEVKPDVTRYTQITQTTLNADYTKTYSYAGNLGNNDSNKYFVNFRRNLANPNIDFISSSGLTGAYTSLWSDATYGKIFDPRLMDNFANNLRMDGTTPIISPATLATVMDSTNQVRAKPLAADPFMGMSSKINPFYTFYCLDTALDVKARIRMVVREWDRIFPSSSSDLDYISDFFKGSDSRQDVNTTYVELPGNNDSLNYFNDVYDWDDFIDMDRTPGVPYDPALTEWTPTSGWFSSTIFPNNEY